MWLRRLVGLVLIITCLGMNVVATMGLFVKDRNRVPIVQPVEASVPLPTVSMTVNPAAITVGDTSALTWATTGVTAACKASGTWTGEKTPFGAESTGRIKTSGNYPFTLTCSNSSGSAEATATVTVGNAAPPPKSATSKSSSSSSATYCSGRTPCYGPKDISTHGSAGNCWGYNIDRVLNITGFDANFHKFRSAVSSIEVSQICGTNIAPALSGQVGASGAQGRSHNPTTQQNADKNMFPYFVGYFDSSKP